MDPEGVGFDQEVVRGDGAEQRGEEPWSQAADVGTEDDGREKGDERGLVAHEPEEGQAEQHRQAGGQHGHSVGNPLRLLFFIHGRFTITAIRCPAKHLPQTNGYSG